MTTPSPLKTLCVYCGANPGRNPLFTEQALELADRMVERGITLVYGGSKVGLMGKLADRVLANGGEVIGVTTQHLMNHEVAHTGLTTLHVADTMNERKAKMLELSSAVVALPGGFGTLDELFEALTLAQLRRYQAPCGLLNTDHYYDQLIIFLQHAEQQGLLASQNLTLLQVAETPGELLDRLEHSAHKPVDDSIYFVTN
ncbi:TIGR00730 family Rossman fold protein [Kistimonas asteriae]|uniref:LOG family protein n=1 Tax=Kistimonas asteriae TaxID=517724 RepID=UPI001BA59F89|nr:TIGR00730 family Rossman fold protein [Kistimonas asteriae]